MLNEHIKKTTLSLSFNNAFTAFKYKQSTQTSVQFFYYCKVENVLFVKVTIIELTKRMIQRKKDECIFT